METSIPSPFLTVEQVAQRYSVSKDTIWRWRRERDFPRPVKLGGKTTRWRLCDLEEWEGRFICALATHLRAVPDWFPPETAA
jgi:prophage regulatory protein